MRMSHLADDYMQLKALQADLARKEEALKLKLLALKDTEIEGKLARVVISTVDGRTTYDAERLKELVPAATLSRCSKTGAPSIRFTVKARISPEKKVA